MLQCVFVCVRMCVLHPLLQWVQQKPNNPEAAKADRLLSSCFHSSQSTGLTELYSIPTCLIRVWPWPLRCSWGLADSLWIATSPAPTSQALIHVFALSPPTSQALHVNTWPCFNAPCSLPAHNPPHLNTTTPTPKEATIPKSAQTFPHSLTAIGYQQQTSRDKKRKKSDLLKNNTVIKEHEELFLVSNASVYTWLLNFGFSKGLARTLAKHAGFQLTVDQ